MKFFVFSEISAARIASSLGASEYSYYFVLKEFLPVLQMLGEVVVVENPEAEVDQLYDIATAAGEDCLFLSFSPPHKMVLTLRCPTIPVFAWEFDSIPNEHWLDDLQQDWRYGLAKCGMAITHSELTVAAVKRELGDAYPIVSIPAPVWDKYAGFRARATTATSASTVTLKIAAGVVLDTHDVSLESYRPGPDTVAKTVAAAITIPIVPPAKARMEPLNVVEPRTVAKEGAPSLLHNWVLRESEVKLSGVVFTSLFNPYDGRKNRMDMLTAFCTAFRDTPDATLLFKLGHVDYESAMTEMLMCLARLPPFKCRVVLLQGYLEGGDFESLIQSTAFIVNASYGEGQCLPLMEFLSCGKPAVAPRHTAMLDYIDDEVAFVVDSWLDAYPWSHDPRLAYRTLRHEINWESLVAAYQSAYRCFKEQPERYQAMAQNAVKRMQTHCSRDVAKSRLQRLLDFHREEVALTEANLP